MSSATHDDGWQVELDASDAAALTIFEEDRAWNGYSIADLAPPWRPYTTVALARRRSSPASAACLFLRHPGFNSIIPHGDPAGLGAILAAADLPAVSYLLVRPAHLAAIEQRYRFPVGKDAMLRMVVSAGAFQPTEGRADGVERLGPADLPALVDLYSGYEGNAFSADQLTAGLFYGVRLDGQLVAAGGTHAVAPDYGIAAVGNIFTLPAYRGRRLGRAITAAVVGDLLRGPYHDVILNVAVANETAFRLYARLGFHEHCRYWEARIELIGSSRV